MITLKSEIDISPAIEYLHGLSKIQIDNAWRRTLRKTARWVKAAVANTLRRHSGIPSKLIERRLYFFLRSLKTAKVWLGLNAIKAHELGKSSRQTASGVTVGRHHFNKAWTRKVLDPYGVVYRRTGNFQWVPVPGRGKALREAYEVVKYDWNEAGQQAFDRIEQEAGERINTIFRQELNYELLKMQK
jgi:hypothetical protein